MLTKQTLSVSAWTGRTAYLLQGHESVDLPPESSQRKTLTHLPNLNQGETNLTSHRDDSKRTAAAADIVQCFTKQLIGLQFCNILSASRFCSGWCCRAHSRGVQSLASWFGVWQDVTLDQMTDLSPEPWRPSRHVEEFIQPFKISYVGTRAPLKAAGHQLKRPGVWYPWCSLSKD